MKTIKNLNSAIYYQGHYWNDIPLVIAYISKNFTGDENRWWTVDFKERYAQKPFKHALFLNCGDGRWEREFVDNNIVRKVTAFDVSEDLIKKAKSLRGKRTIIYIVGDANKINFKKNTFDLVVNIAALHHTQYINRLLRILAHSLKKGGIFISYDYTGPHRNQYPLHNWLLVRMVNKILPQIVKKPNLSYPHLPTMLKTDPTEAIHSDLIIKTIKRYFRVVEMKNAAGAIAYEILTHNPKLTKRALRKRNVLNYIKRLLLFDNIFTRMRIVPTFFSYIIAKPNKNSLLKRRELIYYQDLENIREYFSEKLGGTYTFFDYLIVIKSNDCYRERLKLIIKYILVIPQKIFGILLINIRSQNSKIQKFKKI